MHQQDKANTSLCLNVYLVKRLCHTYFVFKDSSAKIGKKSENRHAFFRFFRSRSCISLHIIFIRLPSSNAVHRRSSVRWRSGGLCGAFRGRAGVGSRGGDPWRHACPFRGASSLRLCA